MRVNGVCVCVGKIFIINLDGDMSLALHCDRYVLNSDHFLGQHFPQLRLGILFLPDYPDRWVFGKCQAMGFSVLQTPPRPSVLIFAVIFVYI